jgi:acetyl-CoA acyltransferase 1
MTFHPIQIFSGAGVESMTFGYGPGTLPDGWSDAVMTTQEAEDCLIPMGFTSENVASDFGISREAQDKFAAASFQKAAAAQQAGKFKAEILPIKVNVVDPKTDKQSEIVVDSDDGIRAGVTAESLAKLKPAFSKAGSTHAGE